MIYNLSNGFQRKAFLAKSEDFLEKGIVVELTAKMPRSRNQNSYLHLIIGVVAMDTGNTLAYAKEQYFKRLVNPDLFIQEVTDPYAGKVRVIRSLTDLTQAEVSMAIDRFKRWAAEQGIYLPNPGDEALLRDIEIEMGRQRNYLGG